MAGHDWIGDVLEDLREYCEKNDLNETQALVQNAKSTFEAESRAVEPYRKALEDFLVQAEDRPI